MLKSPDQKVEAIMLDCGIDMDYITPQPIGRGANKIVYLYDVPGKEAAVVKVHIGISQSRRASLEVESRQLALINEYFYGYIVNSRLNIGTRGTFCTIMDYVEGGVLDSVQTAKSPFFKAHLEELVRRNLLMLKEEGYSIDFIGLGGALAFLRSLIKSDTN
jgi:hypothetical protein